MQAIKDTIRQFILAHHLPGEGPETLRDETPLQTSGILDSLAVLELAAFVERTFGVELDIYDLSVDRFDRINAIAEAVWRKQSRSAERKAS